MEITVVVENTSVKGLAVEHGLSLWVEACGRSFFFDLGQGRLFADNSQAMGIDVAAAEFAVVSHGHYDHGGGIAAFMEMNDHAPVILSRKAFTDCYSMREGRARYIGLSKDLQGSSRLVFADDVMPLSQGLTLFAGCTGRLCFSPANQRIMKLADGCLVQDDFQHEQSLVICEGERRVLLAGCAHSGILNIMSRAEAVTGAPLTDVVAGMHLVGVDDEAFIANLARELMKHNCQYHTCHCTGEPAFRQLRDIMGRQINYIACGDKLSF